MDRAGLCAAFSMLVPGPKMIWQFGELGYDYSINQNEEGEFHETETGGYRTSLKPVRWDYFNDGVEGSGEDEIRRGLYNTYSKLLTFRKQNSKFYDMGAEFRWYVTADNWPGRYLFIKSTDGANMALFGNFGSGKQNISVELPHGGTWYNAFTGDTWNGANHTCPMEEGKFYLLVDSRDAVITWNEGSEPAPKPETPETPGDGDQTAGTVYLKVNTQWPLYNARFAIYFIGEGDIHTWVDMEAYKAGIYKCAVPTGYDKMIFVRFNPDGSTSDWNNKWGQTEDLSVPTDEKVCYVLNEGFWDKEGGQSGGAWQEYTPGSESEDPDIPVTPETPESKEVRIYIQHNWDWNYGLWCWMSDGTQIFGGNAWPGKRPDGVETKDGMTYSYWTVPAEHVGKTVSLLITDAKDDWSSHDQQTKDFADVTLSESIYFRFDYIDNENRLIRM